MDYNEKINNAHQRSARGLAKRPELAKLTRVATARMTDGLTCAIETDEFKLVADSPEVAGGNNAGPTPNHLLLSAYASCLAIALRAQFALKDVPLRGIEVEVTGHYDVLGIYDLADTSPGLDGPLHYTVRVDSPAQPDTVRALLQTAEAKSPLKVILANSVPVERAVRLNGTEI